MHVLCDNTASLLIAEVTYLSSSYLTIPLHWWSSSFMLVLRDTQMDSWDRNHIVSCVILAKKIFWHFLLNISVTMFFGLFCNILYVYLRSVHIRFIQIQILNKQQALVLDTQFFKLFVSFLFLLDFSKKCKMFIYFVLNTAYYKLQRGRPPRTISPRGSASG